MAETLGSLCDKLTIIKLKQWHSDDPNKLLSLADQEKQLQDEIGEFVNAAIAGHIPVDRLTFASNKIFKKEGNIVSDVQGSVGKVFSILADVNCKLWHEQEKVYEIEKVPAEKKDSLIKDLAHLNLERNKCIEEIDRQFSAAIKELLNVT